MKKIILSVFTLSIMLMSCSKEDVRSTERSSSLENKWKLQSIVDVSNASNTFDFEDCEDCFTLVFENGQVSGRSIINVFSGDYQASEGNLVLGTIRMTEAYELGFGSEYTENLFDVQTYVLDNDILKLTTSEGIVLEYTLEQ